MSLPFDRVKLRPLLLEVVVEEAGAEASFVLGAPAEEVAGGEEAEAAAATLQLPAPGTRVT